MACLKYYIKPLIVFLTLLIVILSNPPNGYTFEKYPQNPILNNGSLSEFDSKWATNPMILYDSTEPHYRLWYTGNNYTLSSTGYAFSNNLIHWVKYDSNPVLAWNSAIPNEPKFLFTPAVIKDNNLYKMWFTTTPNDYNNFHIGYAESPNGLIWTKMSYNIFDTLPDGTWGKNSAVNPYIIKRYNNL